MKRKLLSFMAGLLSICAVFLVANASDSCQHHYVFDGVNNGTVFYTCNKCNDLTSKSISSVLGLWNDDVFNTTDDNSFVDLVPDGFVNAKDYVKINDEYKKYKKLPTIDFGGEI